MIDKTSRKLAEEHYDKIGENFLYVEEMHHEMPNGWVIDIPHSYGMGYFYEDGDDLVLYVTYVNGDMWGLLRFSIDFNIDKIEFKRNFTGEVKRYEYKRFEKRIEYGRI